MLAVWRRSLAFVRTCFRAQRGNISMIFAIALVPMVLAAGAGVDFTRAMIVRSNMSSALDAAALAVGASSGLTTAEMTTLAQSFFDANYKEDSSYGDAPTLTVTTSTQQIVITATCKMSTIFIKLAGINTLTVGASSTVVWGQVKLWVALVLDNTGSMASSGKLTALKTASKNLLTTLKSAASTDGDVRVAIVPFSKDVNVGSSNYSATWLDWTSWDAANGSYTTTSSCTGSGRSQTCTTTKTWTAASHSTWNGCVMDRTQNYDVLDTTPSSSATYFPTEQYSNCPEAILGLSYDWTALTAEIDGMVAVGSTNQTIGLVWGWQALTQGLPMSPPTLPDDTSRIIILLSDGLNTQNRWSGNGSDQSTAVDARMALACANAKADGIIIYTVLVMAGNSSILQSCATDSSKYFVLTSASQIITTFNTIAQQITNLRVSE
jgi:Flp pilus assembly protein TadG